MQKISLDNVVFTAEKPPSGENSGTAGVAVETSSHVSCEIGLMRIVALGNPARLALDVVRLPRRS